MKNNDNDRKNDEKVHWVENLQERERGIERERCLDAQRVDTGPDQIKLQSMVF